MVLEAYQKLAIVNELSNYGYPVWDLGVKQQENEPEDPEGSVSVTVFWRKPNEEKAWEACFRFDVDGRVHLTSI